jgi:hypothetical protein
MRTLAAGAFDAWASSALGGLLGIGAALLAIWLTRRADREKSLNDAALRSGEAIATALAKFIRVWEATPLFPVDEWHAKIKDGHVTAYLDISVHAPLLRNDRLARYLSKDYHRAIVGAYDLSAAFVKRHVDASPGDASEIKWESFESQFKTIDDVISLAAFEAFDNVNAYRETLKPGVLKVHDTRSSLIEDVRAQVLP